MRFTSLIICAGIIERCRCCLLQESQPVLVAGFVCVVVYGSLSLCTHHVYIKLSYLVNTCMRDVLQLLPWLQRSCPNECNSCTCGGCDSDMWLVVRVKVPMLWCTAVGL